MRQLQADQDRIHTIVDGLAAMPQANTAEATAIARKHHRGWIANLIGSSCTNKVIQVLEAPEEDHKQDGVLMFFA